MFADNTACTGWYRNSRKHLIISSCTVYTVHYSVQGTNIFIVYSTGCPNKHGDQVMTINLMILKTSGLEISKLAEKLRVLSRFQCSPFISDLFTRCLLIFMFIGAPCKYLKCPWRPLSKKVKYLFYNGTLQIFLKVTIRKTMGVFLV